MSISSPPPTTKTTGLGTFGGVFTPSILTILGVIMYLRLGWVVANAGLLGTLGIVTLATSITFLTALSIASIATDQRVGGGGAYFMISRSLGIEAGGAVGIPLYIAQALSVALYTIGFAESVARAFPGVDETGVGLVTTTAVALVALRSARAAIATQYVIMAAIGVSLLSLFFGGSIADAPMGLAAPPDDAVDFWTVFAVFFPAVTGIMAGVNMSGDLADPGRSIPRGTLAAVGSGYVIYMILPIVLALRAGAPQLADDPLVMRKIALVGDAILVGVWGATLSSAVGSILGAPRVLQALARDGVLPRSLAFLGHGSGEADEPRIGTALTFALALLVVMMGDLDAIAPVLTMFFLATYGVLNVTAGLERLIGNPSFRPRFRVHWGWSFLGAAGCVAVMFLIDTPATVLALAAVGGIYLWLERRELESAWGDIRRGLWLSLTRVGLLRLRHDPHPKNWRPHLLVLSGAPARRPRLVELAATLTHNRTLMTVATILPEHTTSDARVRVERAVQGELDELGVQALVRATTAPTPFEGARRLVEIYGLGHVVPNTILLGDSESPEHRDAFCDLLARFYGSRRNTIVVRQGDAPAVQGGRRIDVWWGGLNQNGGLMMILAHLVSTSLAWHADEVVVKLVVPHAGRAEAARAGLEALIESTRMRARTEVIVGEGRSFETILHASSHDAGLVFLGMAPPDRGDFRSYYEGLQRRTAGLPTTLLVLAGEDVAFGSLLVEDEEG